MEHESLPPLQIIGEGVIQLWYNYDTYSIIQDISI